MLKIDDTIVLDTSFLNYLFEETNSRKFKWQRAHQGYIYKTNRFNVSLNIEKSTFSSECHITVMLYVIGKGTSMEVYRRTDKEWEIAHRLKDAIIMSFNTSAA